MRRLAVLVALAVTAVACGGGEAAPSTTTDPRVAAAGEYASTARRAVDTTRFAGLGDDEVAALVLAVCDEMETSADPDATVLDAVAGISAPAGVAADDDEIMAVVLAEGALAVCPDEVDAASLRAWDAAPAEERYLTAVALVAPVLDVEVTDGDLIAAGEAVCTALDAGDGIEAAVLGIFADLFDMTGLSMDEIAAGEAGEREGLLAGGVLGGAASFLCPEHHDAVTAYLEALAEENDG